MKITKAKRDLIIEAIKSGEVKALGDHCYAAPSRFFALGITPAMIASVHDKLEEK